jgi:vacuolar-type H+-ATPase subunit E/Vma4
MKNKKEALEAHSDNAREICSRIREESSEEARFVVEKANKERERILSQAAEESQVKTKAILLAAQKEVEQRKERIFSTVTMEKRRVSLEAKSLFIADVITAVNGQAEKFRDSKDYVKFLRGAISEGVKIVDDKKAQVFYSHIDEGLIPQLSDLPVEFRKSDFREIGVMIQSQDGRLLFDNRFSARLKRAYDDIYMKLLKEAF